MPHSFLYLFLSLNLSKCRKKIIFTIARWPGSSATSRPRPWRAKEGWREKWAEKFFLFPSSFVVSFYEFKIETESFQEKKEGLTVPFVRLNRITSRTMKLKASVSISRTIISNSKWQLKKTTNLNPKIK